MLASSALALDSAVACRAAMALARASTVVLRSPLSPMVAAQEAAEDEAGEAGVVAGGSVGAVAGGGGGEGAAGGGEVGRDDEDRRDRDTRLSRASGPWVAGPRLRSS